MPRRTRVGYETFAQWEKELAKGKIWTLIGKYELTKDDLADMEQELLLHIHRSRNVKKSWKQITASDRTILDRILNNKIRDLIDTHQSLKSQILRHAESLSKEAPSAEEGTSVTYETLLGEEQSLGRMGRSSAQEDELRLALSMADQELSARQRKILTALKKSQSVSEAAKVLRMHRTTLVRELKRLREVFYRRELNEYI
jgi:hypothetical protein